MEDEEYARVKAEVEEKKRKEEETKARLLETFKDNPEVLHRYYGHLFGYDEVTNELMEARKKDEDRNKWHF